MALDDKIFRALGLLKFARLLATEDVLFALSHLRLGINLGRIKDIDMRTINELFLLTQPAHLQKVHKTPLESAERNVARATLLRQRLTSREHEKN